MYSPLHLQFVMKKDPNITYILWPAVKVVFEQENEFCTDFVSTVKDLLVWPQSRDLIESLLLYSQQSVLVVSEFQLA